jgi:hypothetical protein
MNISEAQHNLYTELKGYDNIVGIFNNDKFITVMLLDESITTSIPMEYEGYDVVTEITGEILLQ